MTAGPGMAPGEVAPQARGGLADLLPPPDRTGARPSRRGFRGAALVADASGFTALAAALEAEHGDRGADRLAALMIDALGAAEAIVAAHGGVIADIVGDAVHAVWLDQGQGMAACNAAARAAAEALWRRGAADSPGASLRVTVGVGVGAIEVALLGGVAGRWESLAWGPALRWARSLRLTGPAVPRSGESVEEAPAVWDGGSPSAVAWSSELRVISVLFCRLSPPGELVLLEPLHQAVRRIQQIAATFGGVLDKITADEKGVAAILGFGLPPSGTEGAAERAVLAALAMVGAGDTMAIGLATGKVYVGEIGAGAHAQYTMYGPAANRAARLMGEARDRPLCDAATRTAAAQSAMFVPRRATLKGLGMIEVFALFETREMPDDEHAGAFAAGEVLVGRAHAQTAVSRLLAGADGVRVLAIIGDVGLGKSALAGEAAGEARADGQAVLVAAPARFGARAPLSAWRARARAALDAWAVAEGLGTAEAVAELCELAGFPPDAAALANPLLGTTLPESAAVLAMPGDERAAAARRLQGALLSWLTGDGPLLILDDADRLDEASLAVAEEVLRIDPDARILLTARDGATRGPAALIARAGKAADQVALGPLTRDETAMIAGAFVSVVGDHPLVDWLHERCRGNPQLARELLAALPADLLEAAVRTPGAWRTAEPALRLAELPVTIEAAIVGRIARQSMEAQALLKAASVLGGPFEAAALVSLGLPDPPEPLQRRLEGLARDGLLIRDGERWAFAQELARATVHANLPDALRRDLHRRAAEALERDGRFDRAAQLARHWREAGRPLRAFRYARRAGLAAMAVGAHGDAAAQLRAALNDVGTRGLAGRHAELRLARVHSDLAHALSSLSELEAATFQAHTALRHDLGAPPATRAAWTRLLLAETLRLVVVVLAPPRRRPRLRDRYAAALRLRAAYKLSDTLVFTGGPVAATAISVYGARQAERVGDLASAARPYGWLGYAAGLMRLGPVARFCFARPRSSAILARNWSALQFSLGGELWLAMAFGEWARADRLAQTAERLGRRARGDIGQAYSLALRIQRLMYTGALRAAREPLQAFEALSAALANDQYLTWCLVFRGRYHLAMGEPDAALAKLNAAGPAVEHARDLTTALLLHGCRAAALTRLGRAAEVEAEAALVLLENPAVWHFGTWDSGHGLAEALIARQATRPSSADQGLLDRALRAMAAYARLYPLGGPALAFHRGARAAVAGRWRSAARHWRAGAALAKRLGLALEQARLLDALARVPSLTEEARAGHRAAAEALAQAGGAVIPTVLFLETRR